MLSFQMPEGPWMESSGARKFKDYPKPQLAKLCPSGFDLNIIMTNVATSEEESRSLPSEPS
jgi:hypothetical protein